MRCLCVNVQTPAFGFPRLAKNSIMKTTAFALLLLTLSLSATEIFVDIGEDGNSIKFNRVEVTRTELICRMDDILDSWGKTPIYLRCFSDCPLELMLDTAALLKPYVESITLVVIKDPADHKKDRLFKIEVTK